MTDQEILEKAITKAIDSGWTEGNQALEVMAAEPPTKKQLELLTRSIIFNHNFAKSLWGEWTEEEFRQLSPKKLRRFDFYQPWQYHLQQMVISEDPIAYLGENL